jgi:tight adherence protein B
VIGAAVVCAALAGAAAAVLLAVPPSAALRLDALTPDAGGTRGDRIPAGARPRRRLPAVGAVARRHADERARAREACTALAGELRAGRSPAEALSVAAALATGPTGEALQAGASAAALGGDVGRALVLRPATGPSAAPQLLQGLAACWSVCATTGSGLATAVDRLEEAERDSAARRRAVEAELAGPRATARLLALLPVLGVVMAAALGADPLHVLLHTALGAVCLVLGVGLELVGLWWTGRIVARAAGGP